MYAICIRHEMDMAHLPVGNFSRAKFHQTSHSVGVPSRFSFQKPPFLLLKSPLLLGKTWQNPMFCTWNPHFCWVNHHFCYVKPHPPRRHDARPDQPPTAPQWGVLGSGQKYQLYTNSMFYIVLYIFIHIHVHIHLHVQIHIHIIGTSLIAVTVSTI